MKVSRLVIDTNVWIAALFSPTGVARRVVDAVVARGIDVLMSEAAFDELVSRLAKAKFDRYRDPESWNIFLSAIVDLASGTKIPNRLLVFLATRTTTRLSRYLWWALPT